MTRNTRTLTISAALAALFVTTAPGVAGAQSSPEQACGSKMQHSSRSSEMQQSMHHRQAKAGAMRQVTGEVIGEKNVDIRGKNVKHKVVHLKTADNRRVVADLGSTRDLRNIDINVGDKLHLEGRAVRIGNRTILAANKVQTNGQTVRIDRDRQAQRLAQQGEQESRHMSKRAQRD